MTAINPGRNAVVHLVPARLIRPGPNCYTAVMPTAAAPILAETNCHVSDGMMCSTMPPIA
jgi:hypothetical protein